MIGTILKGYRILDKVKEGSVGTVWRAADSSDRIVALKQISAKNAARREKLREFKREATLTHSLDFPTIIKVFEYVPQKPQPFFTMEYFESENLKFRLWHDVAGVYKKEFYILRQIAEALAYLHGRGIVHRDIKPENVLVSKKNEVRLIDFSLAQTRFDRLLQFGRRVCGTPLYMAPEQIRGEKCDTRSDLYSFGALVYEVLTKRPPFIGTTERSILEKHLRTPPIPMTAHVKTLSPDLDRFVMTLLAKDPKDRYSDLTPVIHELSKWERQDTIIRVRQVDPGRPRDTISAP